MSAQWGVWACVAVCVLSVRRVMMLNGPAPLWLRVRPAPATPADDRRTRFAGLAVTAMLAIITANVVVAALALLFTVFGLPLIHGYARRRRESNRFRSELPAFVEEFARGLRGGLSPSQALLDGSRRAEFPFPQAFLPAATLLSAGAKASEAVTTWAAVRDDPSLRFLATAIAVGDSIGGIDGRSADAVAAALRERAAVESMVRVQATQALYSAGVLCGAPVVFCALVVMSDQRSSAFLLRSPVGMALGAGGLILDLLGAVWMRRLVGSVVR